MMQGHFGAALIVSALSHRSFPLCYLFLASQVQDLMIALLVYTLHIEETRLNLDSENKVYPFDLIHVPYSHSLFSTLLLCSICYVLPIRSMSAKHTLSATVASHWLLDFVVHTPDLDVCFPFADCGKAGLGLWRYLWPSVLLESGLVIVGFVGYVVRVPKIGHVRKVVVRRLLPLVMFMVFVTVALPFAPPPPKLDSSITVQTFVSYGLSALLAWAVERPVQRAESSCMEEEKKRK